jgi:hypothetical protein
MEKKNLITTNSTKSDDWVVNYWDIVEDYWLRKNIGENRKIYNKGGFIPMYSYPKIEKIIYNMKNPMKPATVCYWKDGTKTVVVCSDKDTFTKEMGVAMCFIRKMMPNRSEFLRLVESGYVQE